MVHSHTHTHTLNTNSNTAFSLSLPWQAVLFCYSFHNKLGLRLKYPLWYVLFVSDCYYLVQISWSNNDRPVQSYRKYVQISIFSYDTNCLIIVYYHYKCVLLCTDL